MLPCAGEKGLKSLREETAGLNVGTVHTRLSLTPCLLNQTYVQIYAEEKVILPSSAQINPTIQVNSPPVQEIPLSLTIRETIIFGFPYNEFWSVLKHPRNFVHEFWHMQ